MFYFFESILGILLLLSLLTILQHFYTRIQTKVITMYRSAFFRGMESDETLEKFLDRRVRPDTQFLTKCGRVIDNIVRLVHKHPKFSVNQVIKGGSLGKGTGVRDYSDVDLLVVLNNYKSVQALYDDMDRVLSSFRTYLQSSAGKLGRNTSIRMNNSTPYALRFSFMCDDEWVDVDLLPIVDVWSTWLLGMLGGVSSTYSTMENESHLRKYYAKSLAKLQIDFVKDRPSRVKDLIRLLKYWKYTENIDLSSYGLELVAIYAWEQEGAGNNFTMKTMMTKVVQLLKNYDNIAISWNNNYSSSSYVRKLGKSSPYILDPANPFHDLAADPSFSFGHLRRGYYDIKNKANELDKKFSNLPETSSCVLM